MDTNELTYKKRGRSYEVYAKDGRLLGTVQNRSMNTKGAWTATSVRGVHIGHGYMYRKDAAALLLRAQRP